MKKKMAMITRRARKVAPVAPAPSMEKTLEKKALIPRRARKVAPAPTPDQ